jgi:hypothetical protein
VPLESLPQIDLVLIQPCVAADGRVFAVRFAADAAAQARIKASRRISKIISHGRIEVPNGLASADAGMFGGNFLERSSARIAPTADRYFGFLLMETLCVSSLYGARHFLG